MKPISRTTHTLDATGQPVGRLAAQVATLLRGKHKVNFEMHLDQGDHVQVTGVANIKFTGKKLDQKVYRWHTNFPGGLKTLKASTLMKTDPADILRRAVYGMLPKNSLRDKMMKRLKIK